MELYQLVHTLNYGDAISNEALTIKRLLARRGINGGIYAINAHEKVEKEAEDWTTLEQVISERISSNSKASNPVAASSQITLLSHYSIGSPLNDLFQAIKGVRKGIVYHNLTPAHWFESYNPRVVEDLKVGRKELPQLLAQADFVVADSEYNRAELSDIGYDSSLLLSLPLDTDKWNIVANSGIAAALNGHGGKNVLHVGRLAPNKCIEDIIKSFYFYHHKIERKSKLWLIGIDIDTEIYSYELRRLVEDLRLSEFVEFIGAVHDSELRAFYENSDLYMCMSEHEGFCVPLLEAMHFGLPIIAYDSCAVGDTLGDAGLLLGCKSPAEISELMDMVISDSALRGQLVAKGQKRVQSFSTDIFEQDLFDRVIRPVQESVLTDVISGA